MIEGGKTPFLPAGELEALGFKIVIYALSGLFATVKAIQEVAEHLNATGTTAGYDRLVSFHEFEQVIGLEEYKEIEERFAVR